jgi:hypothetical protein
MTAAAHRSRVHPPEIVELPARTMAVVRTVGDPNEVGQQAAAALYGAVYPLKFRLRKQGVEFRVEGLRARWPDAHLLPRELWTAVWALPVPDGTAELSGKAGQLPVAVETWQYGTVAQILHRGTYAEEGASIDRLHAFIAEQGYEIAGPHEEEYLTRPDARDQRTLIRYQLRRIGA